MSSGREITKSVPVGFVVHGRHVAFLDHTVFLGEIGLSKCLFESAMFTCRKQAVQAYPVMKAVSYSLIRRLAKLLANKVVHPLVGLIVVATVGRKAGNDERHVW